MGPKIYMSDSELFSSIMWSNLFLHDWGIHVLGLDQGRLEEAFVDPNLPAKEDITLGFVKHVLEALCKVLSDDAAVVLVFGRIISVEANQRSLELLDQLIKHGFITENVIGGNAGLTAVYRLARNYAIRRILKVTVFGHNSWTRRLSKSNKQSL